MSDAIDDGGPAFPTDPNTQPGFYQHHGMSLRDYFAGQALANPYTTHETDQYQVARWAYAVADAMLKRRKVQP